MNRECKVVSFVSRIWLEPGPEGEQRLRGHIRHVQSDQEEYFADLSQMVGFLEKITGITFPQTRVEGGRLERE